MSLQEKVIKGKKNSYFVQLGDNRMFYVIFLGFPLSYLLTELITMFYTEDLSN